MTSVAPLNFHNEIKYMIGVTTCYACKGYL